MTTWTEVITLSLMGIVPVGIGAAKILRGDKRS